MKSIVIIVVLVFVFLAGYSYYSKEKSKEGLKKVRQQGADISLVIDARPIVAIDSDDEIIYIISQGDIRKLVFSQIDKIELVESPEKGNNASEKIGPDYGLIYLNSGEKIRFGDMPDTAVSTKIKLGQFESLLGKILVVESK